MLSGSVKTNCVQNQGERVVNGQHLMQASTDIFFGWQRQEGPDGEERDFYVRQLRDGKGSVVVQEMVPDGMRHYGYICGRPLARTHARSGDRVAIAAYLGSSDRFEHAIADFAETCAEQNLRDHEALGDAVAAGCVIAQTIIQDRLLGGRSPQSGAPQRGLIPAQCLLRGGATRPARHRE